MRGFHVGATSLVLSLTALLAACSGTAATGPQNPFAPPPPPGPSLFISPFGEIFVADAGEPWPSSDWFVGADQNTDGAVDFEEFAADGRRWFALLDTDRDGRLNQTELLAYEARLRDINLHGPTGSAAGGDPSMGLGASNQPRPGGSRPQRPGRDGQLRYGTVADAGYFNLPQPVKSADVNIDQRLTAEEWDAATQRWFLSLDTDRDGRLTQATLPKTPLQRRGER